ADDSVTFLRLNLKSGIKRSVARTSSAGSNAGFSRFARTSMKSEHFHGSLTMESFHTRQESLCSRRCGNKDLRERKSAVVGKFAAWSPNGDRRRFMKNSFLPLVICVHPRFQLHAHVTGQGASTVRVPE